MKILCLLSHLNHLYSHWSYACQLFHNQFLPLIKTAVDNGIVHCGAHGKPKAGQIDLLNVFPPIQLLIDPSNHEVNVVGQPADGKCQHNHNHHFYHLKEGSNNAILQCTLAFFIWTSISTSINKFLAFDC